MEKDLRELMVISNLLFSLNKEQEERIWSSCVSDSTGNMLCRQGY